MSVSVLGVHLLWDCNGDMRILWGYMRAILGRSICARIDLVGNVYIYVYLHKYIYSRVPKWYWEYICDKRMLFIYGKYNFLHYRFILKCSYKVPVPYLVGAMFPAVELIVGWCNICPYAYLIFVPMYESVYLPSHPTIFWKLSFGKWLCDLWPMSGSRSSLVRTLANSGHNLVTKSFTFDWLDHRFRSYHRVDLSHHRIYNILGS
jgi:hypothetical protein